MAFVLQEVQIVTSSWQKKADKTFMNALAQYTVSSDRRNAKENLLIICQHLCVGALSPCQLYINIRLERANRIFDFGNMKTCMGIDLLSMVEVSVPIWFLPKNCCTERCIVMMQNALAQSVLVFFVKCISADTPELEGSRFVNSSFDVEAY
jgi:hypothetical protein